MNQTPKMSPHATKRCEQLGISTKRAKRIVRTRTSTYTGGEHANDALICQSSLDPDYSVVWNEITNLVITVVPRIEDNYVRTISGYQIEEQK